MRFDINLVWCKLFSIYGTAVPILNLADDNYSVYDLKIRNCFTFFFKQLYNINLLKLLAIVSYHLFPYFCQHVDSEPRGLHIF